MKHIRPALALSDLLCADNWICLPDGNHRRFAGGSSEPS